MKKINLALLVAALWMYIAPVSAQTILFEDFETESTTLYDPNMPEGWTTQASYLGNEEKYRWNNYYTEKGTINGNHCAYVDAPLSFGTEGFGPREEILLSPELTLDGTYQLSYNWKAASASALNNKEYDFQIRVVVDGDLANAETIWSFQDPQMLKDSGIPVFPWTGWQIYNSRVGLEKFQGKKVKIAFVYKMLKKFGNCVFLDDIKVAKYTPVTTPTPSLSKTLYNFGNVYMGEKMWSEVITLKNTGAKGLTISDVQLPNGFGTNLDYANVNLDKNESVEFQISYHSTLTSAADANIVFKTSGGDATLRVVANKTALPEGATFEGFEKGVPPTGWTTKGWRETGYAIEGDVTAFASASLDGSSYLTTPRLDLSQGSHSVTFTLFEQFESENEGALPENDVKLEFSKDGGKTWSTVWTSLKINAMVTETVNLGTPASDNCYLRWVYGAIEFDPEFAPETSVVFLDRVLLPRMYGEGGKPVASTVISPKDAAVDVFNKNITLAWGSALFADGYKLFIGTDDQAINILNGKDLGDVTTYNIPVCDYATKYNWKVVPYNAQGDAEGVQMWSFTTMADQTIKTFPYMEGFEGEVFPPLGWNSSKDQGTHWDTNRVDPFDGKVSVSASCRAAETETSLTTPDFLLLAEALEMSFYWGNNMSVGLKKDNTGLVENTSTVDNGIDACFFEIYVDGAWKQLGIMSDANNEYWCHETYNLGAYAGKTVAFRWRYIAHNYMQSKGVSLDMITIAPSEEYKTSFNVSSWDAGKVNYNKSVTSTKPLTLVNSGQTALTVATVAFTTNNFSSTLAANTVVEPKKAAQFELTFNAGETAQAVSDKMTVTFTNGHVVELPVAGNALAADIAYYNFEDEEPGTLTPKDFTTIDVDRKSTSQMTGMNYPMYGVPFAFCVHQNSDWNNVFDPVSGDKVLVALSPQDDTNCEDWIISRQMKATSDSHFTFYGRNWNSVNSIMPENRHKVEVLVSTTSNTDRSTFETVMDAVEMPYYNGSYEYFDVDLSQYAGQNIYIALKHFVTAGLAAFFDDFTFEHFEGLNGGVADVKNDAVSVYPNPAVDVVTINGANAADVVISNLSGAVVLRAEAVKTVNVSDLTPGLYLMTVKSENGTFTTKLLKK